MQLPFTRSPSSRLLALNLTVCCSFLVRFAQHFDATYSPNSSGPHGVIFGSGGAGRGLSLPPFERVAFLQTEEASVLFQIHPGSRLSLRVGNNRTSVENKITTHPVLPHEA